LNLTQTVFGQVFHNPILLASGTCGYGEELDGLFDIDRLGGFVIKAVTAEPRHGNAAPRVAEFEAGMINSIGLANVGVERVRSEKLPTLARRLRLARVLVNVAGASVQEFVSVIERLEDVESFAGFELNVSCPNVEHGGALFSTREDLLSEVVAAARKATKRPLIVKLAPNVPDIGRMAEIAVAEGADGLTLINTFPGLLFDPETRKPVVGNGTGGVSGPAILPMGVHAVWQASRRVRVPIIGAGGIRTARDALQYVLAGASLVQIGTATFADPRAGLRVLTGLKRWGVRHGVSAIAELVGSGMV
jgi:dihydroorotate dehydrogenase (NAD+) catalytic subunit